MLGEMLKHTIWIQYNIYKISNIAYLLQRHKLFVNPSYHKYIDITL